MKSRKGQLQSGRGDTSVDWEKIFDSPDNIFTLGPDEYTSIASVRSTGRSYLMTHGYEGVIHVMESSNEGEIDVQFEPAGGGSKAKAGANA